MRPLTMHEIELVSGAETITYNLPAGSSVTTRLEGNQSTTIFVSIPGVPTYTWNSGTYMACTLIGTGFAITAGTLTGNVAIGLLTGKLASYGCTSYMNSTLPPPPGEDGD